MASSPVRKSVAARRQQDPTSQEEHAEKAFEVLQKGVGSKYTFESWQSGSVVATRRLLRRHGWSRNVHWKENPSMFQNTFETIAIPGQEQDT